MEHWSWSCYFKFEIFRVWNLSSIFSLLFTFWTWLFLTFIKASIFKNIWSTYWAINSMGMGNTMVEFFSAEMVWRVWRYLSRRAAGLSGIMSLASFRALLALFSPSAAITWRKVTVPVSDSVEDLTLARASLEASASAARALCRFWGSQTFFTSTLWIWTERSVTNFEKLKDKTYVNSPWLSSVVNQGLQVSGNGVPLRECLSQCLGSKHVPRRTNI